jgi:hypothetical protein
MTKNRFKQFKLGLWTHLERELTAAPCDHTFTHTQAFFQGRADWPPVQRFLTEHGAHCDCETRHLCLTLK